MQQNGHPSRSPSHIESHLAWAIYKCHCSSGVDNASVVSSYHRLGYADLYQRQPLISIHRSQLVLTRDTFHLLMQLIPRSAYPLSYCYIMTIPWRTRSSGCKADAQVHGLCFPKAETWTLQP